jgi:cellulose synthase (UDP-forming)
LNGTWVTTVPLVRGAAGHAEIPLPADLLTSENLVSLHLSVSCASCGGAQRRLLVISPSSEIRVSGSRLPLANDLALLPIPFVDVASQRLASVPVGFSDQPDALTMQAAAVVASWFGVFTDVHGVRFPIEVGNIPRGNAVVFVRHQSELESRLTLARTSGPLVAIRDNPNDPYGKVLVIAGDDANQMLRAAQALTTERQADVHRDTLDVGVRTSMPSRSSYDAPRWLTTSRPSAIGTYTSPDRLKLNGPTSINIFFRVPPDLFVAARPSVPLVLRYEYGGVSGPRGGSLHVRLNDEDIDSLHLPSSQTSVRTAQTVRLPTAWLRPYANTLTLTFEPGSDVATDRWPYVTIDRESSIDLRALPHSVVLPRLELFADAGYPYTMRADLAKTAVVLSDEPGDGELEALLALAGFFGAQTGAPATSLTVTHAARVNEFAGDHLIVFGTRSTQPLLRLWADRLPLDVTTEQPRLNGPAVPNDWLHPEWPFRDRDRQRLEAFLAGSSRFDLALEQIVSPFADDRSVVFVVPGNQDAYPEIPDLFMPALRQGPVYGGVAVSRNGRFDSFLVASTAYRSGELNPYMRAEVFLFEHYWLLPALVLAPLLMIAFQIRRATDRTASQRLRWDRVVSGWRL